MEGVRMSSGTHSGTYYRVEARTTDGEPSQVGKQLIAGNWREVQFEKSPVGIKVYSDEAHRHGYMDYSAAKALQMWILNELGICPVETRITSHRFTMNYEFKPLDSEESMTWASTRFKAQDMKDAKENK
jgi:hypothetical protein